MYFHKQATCDCIIRDHRKVSSVIDVGVKSLYNQITIGIVTTGSTYSRDKSLVKAVLYIYIFLSRCTPIVFSHNLIGSGKKKVVIIIAEVIGYLLPHNGEPVIKGFLLIIERLIQPATIPVFINDDIHTDVQTIAHNFFNTVKPDSINYIVCFIGKHTPCNRDAQGIFDESQKVHQLAPYTGG